MSDHASQSDTPASAEEKTLDKLLAEAQARIEEQRDAHLRAVAEADIVRIRRWPRSTPPPSRTRSWR
jgi:hypothetical protein